MKWRAFVACCALLVNVASTGYALCVGPWQRLPAAGREVLRPVSLALIGTAALTPVALSPTGADNELRTFSQTTLGGSYRPEAISIWAPWVVLGTSGLTYLGSSLVDLCPVARRASAILQGVLGTALLVSVTKFGAGRQWPSGGRGPNAPDRLKHPEDANDYQPLSRGIGAAFPSGHTGVVFAATAALRTSAPDATWWRFAGYPLAVGVGFSMWFGDHHWASDVLSGGLLGEAIGGAAGRAWAYEQAPLPVCRPSDAD